MEKIRIVIDQEGRATIGVECVKGTKCVDITKAIEEALGEKTGEARTREFYEVQHGEARH